MECIETQPCTQGSASFFVPFVHPYARAESRRSSLNRKKFSRWVFIRAQVLLPKFHRSVLHSSLPPSPVPCGPTRAPDHASQARCRPRPTALSHHSMHLAKPSTTPTPTCHRVAPDLGHRCYRGGLFLPVRKARENEGPVRREFLLGWAEEARRSGPPSICFEQQSTESMWQFGPLEPYEHKAIGVRMANQADGIPRWSWLVHECRRLPQRASRTNTKQDKHCLQLGT